MKKAGLLLLTLFSFLGNCFAHYLWIETPSLGKVGKSQEIRVYYGEYTYGLSEAVGGEAFEKVKHFTLWVISETGKKTKLETSPQADHYLANFIPSEKGLYTIILDNDDIEVIDYSQYNFGIFKTHYHSIATFQVGKNDKRSTSENPSGLAIEHIPAGKDSTKLQVLYKGKAFKEAELTVFVADQWSKSIKTDSLGQVVFARPWPTKYIVEVTQKEDVPGNFKGEDYEFIWHCVTFCLNP